MPRKKISYDENIFREIKNFTPEATESTIKTYVYNLMIVAKYFEEPLDPELFSEFDIIKEYLTSQEYSLNTIKNKVSAIISYLKMKKQSAKLIEQYKDYFDMLDGRISRTAKKMEKSTKEKDNWLTKEQLITQLEYLKNELPEKIISYNDLIKWMRYILLLIHLNYPFRNDMAQCEIIAPGDKLDDNINYIIIDKKNNKAKFLIQAYKTKRTYKEKTIPIMNNVTSELIKYDNLLSIYKKEHNIENKNLLIDKKGGSLTTSDFTLFFKTIFSNLKKDITSTMIRKIIVSSLYDVKKIKQLSDVMGHSPETALQYYAKE